jgi:hypothetical protein
VRPRLVLRNPSQWLIHSKKKSTLVFERRCPRSLLEKDTSTDALSACVSRLAAKSAAIEVGNSLASARFVTLMWLVVP